MKDTNTFSHDIPVATMKGNQVLEAGIGLEEGEISPSFQIQTTEEKKTGCGDEPTKYEFWYTSRMTKPYPWQFFANSFNRSMTFMVSQFIIQLKSHHQFTAFYLKK